MKCKCGCRQEIKKGNIYINGHNSFGRIPWNKNLKGIIKSKNKGKSWEDIYGKYKANIMRKEASIKSKGINNPNYGKKHPGINKGEKNGAKKPEVRKILSEQKKGKNNPNYGKENKWGHHSKKSKKKISIANSMEKNSNWRGGKSFEKYTIKWKKELKERIRKRDNYICQNCNKHQNKFNEKLHVHHIDYNKKNCNENNLVSLCRSCHMKTNYNRKYWKKLFSNKLL